MGKYENKNFQTEEKIKKAYMGLYSRKPPKDISVTEICREAGINRCTFYLHYDDVDDLYDRIVREILSETEKRTRHLSRHNIYESQKRNMKEDMAMVDALTYFREVKDYMIPLMMPERGSAFREDLRASIAELFYAAFAYYDQSFGERQEYVIRFITGGIVDDIYLWLLNDDVPVEEMSVFFMDTSDLFPVVNRKLGN